MNINNKHNDKIEPFMKAKIYFVRFTEKIINLIKKTPIYYDIKIDRTKKTNIIHTTT